MTTITSRAPIPEGDVANSILFTDLDLPSQLLAALSKDGYVKPSPIQAAIIPSLLEGRDVIGQAQTGTGKTAAFALPILAQLAADVEAGYQHPSGPSVLILAPTRELAIQVSDAITKYARMLRGIKVLAVYGGADFRGQAVPLSRGVDVVVGTPGRVMDHMRRGTLDVSNVRTLVLDEADEMLRMGFVEDVEWVLSETPPGRQVALFSATMPSEIREIAERQLNDPERIKIEGGSKTADTVRQRYWRVQGMTKVEALCRLLAYEPVGTAIVFVRTREATADLARALENAGYPAAPLSGDIAQHQRERTIDALRQGKLKLVVATDVAARGIDVQSMTHVFNFDAPHDTEAYIHRIGRTGRAGRAGEAVLFVENHQRRLLQKIEHATGKTIQKMEVPTADDVHNLQLERFAEQLKKRLAFKGESPKPAALRSYIERICVETGRDAVDVAAFLVGSAMKKGSGSASPKESAASSREAIRNERGWREPARAPRGWSTQQSQTYRVSVGRDHGVQPGNLVGAIANEAGIDGKAIGNIQIFEMTSTVELPTGMSAATLKRLSNATVMGRPLRLTLEQSRTSASNKPASKPLRKSAARTTKSPHASANKSKHRKGKSNPRTAAEKTAIPNSKPKKGAKAASKANSQAGAKMVVRSKPKKRRK